LALQARLETTASGSKEGRNEKGKEGTPKEVALLRGAGLERGAGEAHTEMRNCRGAERGAGEGKKKPAHFSERLDGGRIR